MKKIELCLGIISGRLPPLELSSEDLNKLGVMEWQLKDDPDSEKIYWIKYHCEYIICNLLNKLCNE